MKDDIACVKLSKDLAEKLTVHTVKLIQKDSNEKEQVLSEWDQSSNSLVLCKKNSTSKTKSKYYEVKLIDNSLLGKSLNGEKSSFENVVKKEEKFSNFSHSVTLQFNEVQDRLIQNFENLSFITKDNTHHHTNNVQNTPKPVVHDDEEHTVSSDETLLSGIHERGPEKSIKNSSNHRISPFPKDAVKSRNLKYKPLHVSGSFVSEENNDSSVKSRFSSDHSTIVQPNNHDALEDCRTPSSESGYGTSPISDHCLSPPFYEELDSSNINIVTPSAPEISADNESEYNINRTLKDHSNSASDIPDTIEKLVSAQHKKKNLFAEEKDEYLDLIEEIIANDSNNKNDCNTLTNDSTNMNCIPANTSSNCIDSSTAPLRLEQNPSVITVIVPVVMNITPPLQSPKVTKFKTILPKPPSTPQVKNNPLKAKNVLQISLVQDKKEFYEKKIYRYLQERVDHKVIFIEDEKKQRSNLHVAVLKNDIEHVFCIVEICLQYHCTSDISLMDAHNKTALDYAAEQQKWLLAWYLTEACMRN